MIEGLGLLLRVGGVFALLAVVLWLLRRTGGLGAKRRGAPVQVLSTTRLGKSAALSVVRVHDREYVLGVTGSGVQVVTSRTAPDQAVTAAVSQPAGPVAPAVGPPTPGEFLRAGWQVLRKRPVEDTALDGADVAVALAAARSRTTTAPFADQLASAQAGLDVPALSTVPPLPRRHLEPVPRPRTSRPAVTADPGVAV